MRPRKQHLEGMTFLILEQPPLFTPDARWQAEGAARARLFFNLRATPVHQAHGTEKGTLHSRWEGRLIQGLTDLFRGSLCCIGILCSSPCSPRLIISHPVKKLKMASQGHLQNTLASLCSMQVRKETVSALKWQQDPPPRRAGGKQRQHCLAGTFC